MWWTQPDSNGSFANSYNNRTFGITKLYSYDMWGREDKVLGYAFTETWWDYVGEQITFDGRIIPERSLKSIYSLFSKSSAELFIFSILLYTVLDIGGTSPLRQSISKIVMETIQAAPIEELNKQIEEREKVRRECHPPQGNHTYIFLLDNETVKIGMSVNAHNRAKAIQGNSGLKILNWACSPSLSDDDARRIESDCHKHFAGYRTRGEFFKITFDEACTYLQSKFKSPLIFGRKEKK